MSFRDTIILPICYLKEYVNIFNKYEIFKIPNDILKRIIELIIIIDFNPVYIRYCKDCPTINVKTLYNSCFQRWLFFIYEKYNKEKGIKEIYHCSSYPCCNFFYCDIRNLCDDCEKIYCIECMKYYKEYDEDEKLIDSDNICFQCYSESDSDDINNINMVD